MTDWRDETATLSAAPGSPQSVRSSAIAPDGFTPGALQGDAFSPILRERVPPKLPAGLNWRRKPEPLAEAA